MVKSIGIFPYVWLDLKQNDYAQLEVYSKQVLYKLQREKHLKNMVTDDVQTSIKAPDISWKVYRTKSIGHYCITFPFMKLFPYESNELTGKIT